MPSNSNEVANALMTTLRGDGQLSSMVNGAIYRNTVKQGITKYVLLTQRAHVDGVMFNAPAYETFLFNVQAIVRDQSGAVASDIAFRIQQLLEFQPLSAIVGYDLMVIKRTEYIDYSEPDDVNNEWQHRGGIYETWVTPLIA